MTNKTTFSPEWFDEAFGLALPNQSAPPAALRKLSEELCKAFTIRGICDPLYICNSIAVELEIGDGVSNFLEKAQLRATGQELEIITKRLLRSYWTCINGDEAQLRTILLKALQGEARHV